MAPSVFEPPEPIRKAFRHRYQWVEDHLQHRFLNENLSSTLQARLHEVLDISGRHENLGEAFFQTVSAYAEERRRSPLWGFRLFQWVIYGLILGAFLLSIGGKDAWHDLLLNPSGQLFTHLLLNFIGTLFSSKGLAALGSYLIVNLVTGFLFYRRYRNILRKSTQKGIGRLKERLTQIWMESVEWVIKDLARLREDLQSRSNELSRLQKDNGERLL